MRLLKMLYVPCKDAQEARTIASELVHRRLAACGNILPNIESIYRWEDAIQMEAEAILIVKTTEECLAECRERIRILHSYKVPCILELETGSVNTDYASWVRDQTLPP